MSAIEQLNWFFSISNRYCWKCLSEGKTASEEARTHRVVEGLESFCHVLRISYAYYPHVTDDGWRHTNTTAEELWTRPATLSQAYFAETDSDSWRLKDTTAEEL
jgi:hypothetical protein